MYLVMERYGDEFMDMNKDINVVRRYITNFDTDAIVNVANESS